MSDPSSRKGAAPSEPAAAEAHEPVTDWHLIPRQRRSVLVVEPEDAWRRKQCYALQKMGHLAAGVSSHSAALLYLRKQVPDLILVDLNLANRGAEALFKQVREQESTGYVPFLFTCRGGHPLEIVKGVPLEPRLVLKKPYTMKKCQEHVAPLLRRLDLIDGFGRLDGFSGRFQELDLYDLLGLIGRYDRNGALTLHTPDRRLQATLRFHLGQLISARCGWMNGADVIMELMLWDEALFEFRPADGTPVPNKGLSKAQLEEMESSLALVDHSRLNPFPRSRRRTGETVVSHITHDASDPLALTDVVHTDTSDSIEPLLEVVDAAEQHGFGLEGTMELPQADVMVALHGRADSSMPFDWTPEELPAADLTPLSRANADLSPVELLTTDLTPSDRSLSDLSPVELSQGARAPLSAPSERLPTKSRVVVEQVPRGQLLQGAARVPIDEIELEEVVYHEEDAPALDLDPGDIISTGVPSTRHDPTDDDHDFALHWESGEWPLEKALSEEERALGIPEALSRTPSSRNRSRS